MIIVDYVCSAMLYFSTVDARAVSSSQIMILCLISKLGILLIMLLRCGG